MRGREKRILIVDDDAAIRTLLVTILRRRGYVVDFAPNGIEAMEHFERCIYALVLLDLMMPRMSGWELLDWLSERPRDQRPLVIVLTAGTEPRDFPADLVAGTIRKPFDVDVLVDTVMACIGTLPETQQLDSCPTEKTGMKCDDGESEVLN
jgi:DNA-binding response OmpR family regulator